MSGHTPGPWAVETPMGESAPWIVRRGLQAYEWEGENVIAALGNCIDDDLPPRSVAQKRITANARLIATAPDLLAGHEAIDAEAPAKEPRDGPTVGFQPSHDPEQDDGNDTVAEAFREGVARGLWEAAQISRAAIAKATGA